MTFRAYQQWCMTCDVPMCLNQLTLQAQPDDPMALFGIYGWTTDASRAVHFCPEHSGQATPEETTP